MAEKISKETMIKWLETGAKKAGSSIRMVIAMRLQSYPTVKNANGEVTRYGGEIYGRALLKSGHVVFAGKTGETSVSDKVRADLVKKADSRDERLAAREAKKAQPKPDRKAKATNPVKP